MISYLSGTLLRKKKDDLRVLVRVNGLGYEVLLPFFVRRAFDDKNEGDDVELEIYYHVTERQPRPTLIGFNREHERTFFERLIGVGGIGPAKAAEALTLSVSTIANAIETGDVKLLARMPGIGERTAEKIVATLRGKMAEWALLKDEGFDTVPKVEADVQAEAVDLLVGLGYKRGDARVSVEEAIARSEKREAGSRIRGVEDLIREVFSAERK